MKKLIVKIWSWLSKINPSEADRQIKMSRLRDSIARIEMEHPEFKLKNRKFMAKTAGSIDFGHPVYSDKLEISKDCTWNPK